VVTRGVSTWALASKIIVSDQCAPPTFNKFSFQHLPAPTLFDCARGLFYYNEQLLDAMHLTSSPAAELASKACCARRATLESGDCSLSLDSALCHCLISKSGQQGHDVSLRVGQPQRHTQPASSHRQHDLAIRERATQSDCRDASMPQRLYAARAHDKRWHCVSA
jgi:hypothetical protein